MSNVSIREATIQIKIIDQEWGLIQNGDLKLGHIELQWAVSQTHVSISHVLLLLKEEQIHFQSVKKISKDVTEDTGVGLESICSAAEGSAGALAW
ncbi:hypothetical protein Cadr_000009217 [Camelus dromedarius]|uniref:Uncharacterized protein n=1 Tax=Camelus dromedarius TaxID=9838 RepID=A0A5N4DJ52_CAMDR|nr:hypothetical protein Cadr_000009217 [Camelus dromedarius]